MLTLRAPTLSVGEEDVGVDQGVTDAYAEPDVFCSVRTAAPDLNVCLLGDDIERPRVGGEEEPAAMRSKGIERGDDGVNVPQLV